MTNDDPLPGRGPDLMRDALFSELAREAEDANGYTTRRAQLVARKLVEKALAGDVAAIREIADRIDGKPPAAARVAQPPKRFVIRWKGADE